MPNPALDVRNAMIAEAYRAGKPLSAIGARFGISRQRVEQIARQMDLPVREPERAVRYADGTVGLELVRKAARPVAAPPGVTFHWCAQCDARRDTRQIEGCRDRFCSFRKDT